MLLVTAQMGFQSCKASHTGLMQISLWALSKGQYQVLEEWVTGIRLVRRRLKNK
jgi:hypothetical protein